MFGTGLLEQELGLAALAVILLALALYIGVSNRRRPSVAVEWFILGLVGMRMVQLVMIVQVPELYLRVEAALAFFPFSYYLYFGSPLGALSWLSYLWTPFTYALLHADGIHLFTNGVGIFIFGRVVAWRLGAGGFFWLFALSSASGALFHLVLEFATATPMIGASAGAMGLMGATFRFVPGTKDRLKSLFWPDETIRQAPVYDTSRLLKERRGWSYVLLCFLIFPVGLIAYFLGTAGQVAVMAHLGGVLFGYFGFKRLDRRCLDLHSLNHVPVVTSKKKEGLAMKFLRGLAIFMFGAGLLMGVFGYYLQALQQ